MKWCITFPVLLLLQCPQVLRPQSIEGRIYDERHRPLMAVHIQWASHPSTGAISDERGWFALPVVALPDTLVVRYIGYTTAYLPIDSTHLKPYVEIYLSPKQKVLKQVQVRGRKPLSGEYAVAQLQPLDIYLLPASQGDPLKAVSFSPSATNTDETAEPVLRGTSSQYNGVFFDGVPIGRPTRGINLHQQGYFSIFSTELIDRLIVYPDNPPLTLGNAAGGALEIVPRSELSSQYRAVSIGLAGVGLMGAKQWKDKYSFTQYWANVGHSALFRAIQRGKLPYLKRFRSFDGGLFTSHRFGKLRYRSLYYALDESFRGIGFAANYRGDFANHHSQWLTTQHLRYALTKGFIDLHASVQETATRLQLGALRLMRRRPLYYFSLNAQWRLFPQWQIHLGTHYRGQRQLRRDTLPAYLFDFGSPTSPLPVADTSFLSSWDAHIYQSSTILSSLKVFQGVRWHYALQSRRLYKSYQSGIKWYITDAHLLILQRGKYHFIHPIKTTLHSPASETWHSDQIALTYQLESEVFKLHLSIFRKREYGARLSPWDGVWYDSVHTRGVETGVHFYHARWHAYISLLSLHQRAKAEGQDVRGSYDFPWWWRAFLTYQGRRFSASVTAQQRPGAWIFTYSRGGYSPAEDLYFPRRSDTQQRLPHYFSVDINLSRIWLREHSMVLIFFHVSNLTDRVNLLAYSYSRDYAMRHPEWLQRRTVYFGCIYQWEALSSSL